MKELFRACDELLDGTIDTSVFLYRINQALLGCNSAELERVAAAILKLERSLT